MAALPGLGQRLNESPPRTAEGDVRRLARNALVPMAAGLLGKALDLGFALLYFRVLGPEASGVYKFLVVFITYLDTLVNFGLNTILAREIARAPGQAGAAFRAASSLRLGLWLLGLPLVALVLGPWRGLADLPAEAALAGGLFYLALLPSVLSSTASGVLWGFERLDLTAGLAVVSTLLKITLGSASLLAGLGVTGLALTAIATNLVTAVGLCWLTARAARAGANQRTQTRDADGRVVPPSVGPDSTGWVGRLALVRESWPLFVNQLLAGLFFKIDSLLLPGLAGLRAAGAYGVGYTVVDGVGVVSSSFTLALFPRLARGAELAGEGFAAAFRLGLRFLLQVAFPLAAGISILAEPVIGLVGGNAYQPEGAWALAVVIWFLPLSFVNGLTQYVLIALGQQRFLTGAFLGALVFNLGANFVLIPRLGILGAALVTIASELVLLVPFWWQVSRRVPGITLWREGQHAVMATLVMAPMVWWVRDAVNPAVAVLAGGLTYGAALWVIGGINQSQKRVLRALVGRAPRPG